MRQVTLITPNCDEASLLLGEKIVTYEAMEKACNALYEMFGTSVLLKGGHFFLEDKAIDFSVMEKAYKPIPKIDL